ncbi:hypothetical protein V5799_002569 [Amblyomma americanum]|uniref:Uncharacterized protein n=1 Tax=Amblyomma americanum TaxID=6943 RepID=A0AAQ4CWZ1_AMBAM
MSSPQGQPPADIDDIETLAMANLSPAVQAYIQAATGRGLTARENRQAFDSDSEEEVGVRPNAVQVVTVDAERIGHINWDALTYKHRNLHIWHYWKSDWPSSTHQRSIVLKVTRRTDSLCAGFGVVLGGRTSEFGQAASWEK